MTAPEVHNHPFDWAFVISVLESRLGMWVGRPTYERAVALVIGFDMAQPERVNGLMQSRVAARHNTGPLGWPWVLKAEATGGDVHAPGDLGDLTPEQDTAAIALLASELRSVLHLADAT